jgi:hypothetical protein
MGCINTSTELYILSNLKKAQNDIITVRKLVLITLSISKGLNFYM